MKSPVTEQLYVDCIEIPKRHRAVDAKQVETLAASIRKIGLKTPITIYSPSDDKIILVAGAHRLAAAKQLGWEKIDCFVMDGSEIEAEMWEIAENLHRAELTVLQRSEQIGHWVELSAKQVSRQPDAKIGRPESGTRRAARELNIAEPEARRAVKVAQLAPEAKQVAIETGLDDNQAVLLAAAKSANSVTYLRQEHERREAERHNRNADRVIELTVSEEFAEWLLAHTELNEIPMLITWLEGSKPRDVIDALRRRAA